MSARLITVLDDLANDQTGRWHALGFQQDEAFASFRADRAEVTQTAIDTLHGYRITRPGLGGWDITVRAAAVLDTATVAAVFASAPLHEIGPRLHARVLTSCRGQTYWIADYATIIHADHTTTTITAHCTSVESARYWAARLVRQVITAQLLAAGAVYAHAAAFSHRGRGVLATGPKGAGKTTTLITGLRLLGGDYVTNDRLLLRHEAGEVIGRPWPAHLRAGIGTLLALPDLVDLVPAELRAVPEHRRWHHPNKIAIEPPDFCRLLTGGQVVSEVRPRLLLWPYISSRDNGAAPTAVSADEAHDMLLTTRLFMFNPTRGASARINHWLTGTPPAAQTAQNLGHVVENLAATVPCYRMPINGDPVALAARISELLAPIPPMDGT